MHDFDRTDDPQKLSQKRRCASGRATSRNQILNGGLVTEAPRGFAQQVALDREKTIGEERRTTPATSDWRAENRSGEGRRQLPNWTFLPPRREKRSGDVRGLLRE